MGYFDPPYGLIMSGFAYWWTASMSVQPTEPMPTWAGVDSSAIYSGTYANGITYGFSLRCVYP